MSNEKNKFFNKLKGGWVRVLLTMFSDWDWS